jgi:hypothetical protein
MTSEAALCRCCLPCDVSLNLPGRNFGRHCMCIQMMLPRCHAWLPKKRGKSFCLSERDFCGTLPGAAIAEL